MVGLCLVHIKMAKTNKIKILFCVQQKSVTTNEQWESAMTHMKLMCTLNACGDGVYWRDWDSFALFAHRFIRDSIHRWVWVCVCVCCVRELTETETDINSRWHELGRHARPTLRPQTLLVTINLDASCSIWLNELVCGREPLVHLTLLRCPNASATSTNMDIRCDMCTHQTTTC